MCRDRLHFSECPTEDLMVRMDPMEDPMDHILPTSGLLPSQDWKVSFLLKGLATSRPASLPTWGQGSHRVCSLVVCADAVSPEDVGFQPGSRQEDSRLQCSEVGVCAAVEVT